MWVWYLHDGDQGFVNKICGFGFPLLKLLKHTFVSCPCSIIVFIVDENKQSGSLCLLDLTKVNSHSYKSRMFKEHESNTWPPFP